MNFIDEFFIDLNNEDELKNYPSLLILDLPKETDIQKGNLNVPDNTKQLYVFATTVVGNGFLEIKINTKFDIIFAEGFIDLTKQWASGTGEKIAVIQRITPKNGVYIDDISDWGKNLGKTNHPEPKFLKVQVQEEVLLNSEKLKQVSEPIPVIENGVHKTMDGMKVYYVDFIEIL